MARDALMVGDRFIIDQRTLGKIGCGDDDAARPLAVRSAGDIVSGSRRLKGGDGLNRYRGFWKEGENLTKFRVHLSDVVAKVFENLIRRCGYVLRIGF